MDITHTEITDTSAFELILKSRSVEMHSRMQQLKPHDIKNINDFLSSTLRSISHYILLNTTKPG